MHHSVLSILTKCMRSREEKTVFKVVHKIYKKIENKNNNLKNLK